MANYKCNSCKASFQQEEFITYCPSCQSTDLVKENNGFGIFLKKHSVKLILGLLILVSLIIGVFYILNNGDWKPPWGGSTTSLKIVYEPAFIIFDDGVEITFYQYELERGKEPGSKIKVEDRYMVNILFNAYKFKIEDADGNSLSIIGNKFYPCDKTDTLFINWINSTTYLPLKPQYSSDEIIYTLSAQFPNRLACRVELEIEDVIALNECRIQVKTNYDKLPESNDVKISVNGKNGNFLQQRVFNAKEIEIYNIWATLGGDTVGYNVMNGNSFEGIDCIIIAPNLGEIAQIGNQYGSAPGNRKNLEDFFNLPGMNMNTVFYIDNVKMGKRAAIENKMRINNENDGATYKIAPNGVKISGNVVTEIRFTSK